MVILPDVAEVTNPLEGKGNRVKEIMGREH
jgi:hypothetical protein